MKRGLPEGVVLVLALTVAPAVGRAADGFPEPAFPTGEVQRGMIVEEVQYRYAQREYTPQVVVTPVLEDAASYDTPEAAAVALLSARIAVDRAWWERCWVSGAVERLAERAAHGPLTPLPWDQEQRDMFRGREVRLTHRLETGPYVVINYAAVFPREAGAPPIKKALAPALIVLTYQDGRWLATDALDPRDPVLMYWTRPGVTTRRIARPIGPGPLEPSGRGGAPDSGAAEND